LCRKDGRNAVCCHAFVLHVGLGCRSNITAAREADKRVEFNSTPEGSRSMAKDSTKNDPRETPKDDPRQQSDLPTNKQTDKPWQGNPEKEQASPKEDIDLENWQKSKTH
jgi:hypothetical protein